VKRKVKNALELDDETHNHIFNIFLQRVAPEYVLTAAHCVGAFNAFEIGALCNANGNCGQFSETIAMQGNPISHPNYNKDTQ